MAGRYCYKDVLPFSAMVAVECTSVGVNVLFKEATQKGLSYYAFIVYSYAVSTLFLFLPLPFIFRWSRGLPPFKFSLIFRIFLLGLIGFVAQLSGYKGLQYTSPTLFSALSNLIPAFTFILAVFFRMTIFAGAFIDKTHAVANYLIENRSVHEVSDRRRLDTKLDELTCLVRQLAFEQNQQQPTVMTCGICAMIDHPTNQCPSLQEKDDMAVGADVFFGRPFQHQYYDSYYNPYYDMYNPGWMDHPKLNYDHIQIPVQQQQHQIFQEPSGETFLLQEQYLNPEASQQVTAP